MFQDIFNNDPECGWALRGDIYLWNMFRAATRNWIPPGVTSTDGKNKALEQMIRELYQKATGQVLEGRGVDSVELFGEVGYGMSKGAIQREWWIEKAMPLLKKRLEDFDGDCTDGKRNIIVIESDITKRDEDVIVCPSNTELNPSGGVGGAIFSAAGEELLMEVRGLPLDKSGNRCNEGCVVKTRSGNLKSRFVYHTVAPNCQRDKSNVSSLDTNYISIFLQAEHDDVNSVAIPSIGTGKNAAPVEEAARIAAEAILRETVVHPSRKFVFCIPDHQIAEAYRAAIRRANDHWTKINKC